jgi:hypothetical protein
MTGVIPRVLRTVWCVLALAFENPLKSVGVTPIFWKHCTILGSVNIQDLKIIILRALDIILAQSQMLSYLYRLALAS